MLKIVALSLVGWRLLDTSISNGTTRLRLSTQAHPRPGKMFGLHRERTKRTGEMTVLFANYFLHDPRKCCRKK
jgi:hypothetical protein